MLVKEEERVDFIPIARVDIIIHLVQVPVVVVVLLVLVVGEETQFYVVDTEEKTLIQTIVPNN